jgi:hypothetical protein
MILKLLASFGVVMFLKEVYGFWLIYKMKKAAFEESQNFLASIPQGATAEEMAERYLKYRGLTVENLAALWRGEDLTEDDFKEAEDRLSTFPGK